MSNLNYTDWTTEEVCYWLGTLSLHHLVPNFERMQIDGSNLAQLSDQDLRSKLKLTKPAEVMAIKGAIRKLVDDASRPAYLEHHNTHRKISAANPRLPGGPAAAPKAHRERSESWDKKAQLKTATFEGHRNTIAMGVRQPLLVQGSASELVDKECKYSGWIRKQGGGYKNCKFEFKA